MPKTQRPEWITIGQITAPHGLDGGMRVFPLTDVEGRFDQLEQAFLLRQGEHEHRPVQVRRVRYQRNLVLVWFEELDSIEAAERYRNALIQVPSNQVAPLPEGYHYVFELVGLRIETTSGEYVGKLKDVVSAGGANDVYVVRRPREDGKRPDEVLIPAIRQVVKEIDIEGGRILIDPMPGLL